MKKESTKTTLKEEKESEKIERDTYKIVLGNTNINHS